MEKKLRGSSWLAAATALAASALLAACGGGGGGGGGSPASGTVRMSMIDNQCGYKNVFVNVTQVRLQKSPTASESDGGWVTIDVPNGPKRVDLLALTNGTFLDLGAATVQAGTYEQLRLVLADTGNEAVLEDGTRHELKTPSAQQSGLKIHAPYTVVADTTTDYVLDFDACKSIVIAGNSGQWILKPVVRLSAKPLGSISGYVTTTMVLGTATTLVTAQQDGTILRSASPDATGAWKLPFLEPGTYSVVITSTDRATGVITSVPVGTTTTVVNGTSSYIVTPSSAMSTVAGTVSNASVIGSGTTATTAADVTAAQALSGGPTITVKSVNVVSTDPSTGTGTYSMTLPLQPPVKTAYSTSGLSFLADAAVDDTYTLIATTPNKAPISRTIDLSATPTVNFAFP